MDRPYDPTDPKSIVRYARRLKGKRLKDVMPFEFIEDRTGVHGKGEVGGFYEAYFGLKTDNFPGPDFREAGIELKAVPVIKGRKKWRIKERTKVTSIDYMSLADETWETASVRKKLEHILFVFYEHIPHKPKKEFRTLGTVLWDAGPVDLDLFRIDWTVIRDKVLRGKAHELSEGMTRYLGASTSGTGRMKDQPESIERAKERSFSFKPSFTRQIFERYVRHYRFESLTSNLGIANSMDLDLAIADRLRSLEGRSIGEVAKALGIEPSKAKDCRQRIIRRYLGAKSGTSRIEEFNRQGVLVKVFPVKASNMKPKEAVSFPAFNYLELIRETWEDSELRQQLSSILFIPLIEREGPDKASSIIGRAFFWCPSHDEEKLIRKDWEMYVDAIREGRADDLPKASVTNVIHVRPHARNKKDTLPAPTGPDGPMQYVVKKSFWLNTKFLGRLLRRNG